MTNETIIDDQKLVQEEFHLFYSNLYKSKFNESDCDLLFKIIDKDIKKLDFKDNHKLEEKWTKIEIENALKQMKKWKNDLG